jgi:hypothetical protein
MPQEIEVTVNLPGNAARKLTLAALAAKKFGRPDTITVDDVSVPNPETPMDYLEAYFEQALSDVLGAAVGEIAAENARKRESEKDENQFTKRQK